MRPTKTGRDPHALPEAGTTVARTEKVSYRLKEAAAATGVSPKTLLRQIYAGRLEAKKLGDGPRAAYIIPADALDKWLKNLNDAA